ncbi:polysaccharide deacetylase family protein [Candidatus Woesearchaeota archaeon]|nr:polysaccharide deacetylase family protein [Candidatus Woesearchaeota archaeon]
MVSVCFYFQVHQPFRMRNYPIFDIGKRQDYFDDEKNIEVLLKVARKCYLPANQLMLKLLKAHPEFRISFSLSGVFIEQCERWAPEVIESFKKLADTGKVEILSETYYHSLAYLFSKEEFKEQIEMHKKKIQDVFGVTPTVFRNTELIYSNEIAEFIEDMGFKGILSEGWDPILKDKSPNLIYRPATKGNIRLLMKNYRMADDIAFRFSNKGWSEWPLTTDKFCQWVNSINNTGKCLNLFMDYETFGEHQWEDTGIFNFISSLPSELLKNPDNDFKTPSELIDSYEPEGEINCQQMISWADVERDLSAWLGNRIQRSSASRIYEMEKEIKECGDKDLINDWRKLQTSDHFYYMCTKWFNDGDVHKYFNPYDSPYDSFINFMNVMNDLTLRLKDSEQMSVSSADEVNCNEMGKAV